MLGYVRKTLYGAVINGLEIYLHLAFVEAYPTVTDTIGHVDGSIGLQTPEV